MAGSITSAPLGSDLAAAAEVGIAVALLIGMFVVRRGNIRLHMYLQSSVIFGNLPIALLWMVPQYVKNVLPDVPGGLENPTYLLPSVMLAAGGLAEGLGIFIVLVAATRLIPERFRFRSYKRWMRFELALWWTVVAFGLSTYVLWYAVSGGQPS